MKYLDHIFSLLKAKGLIKKEKAKRGGYLLARAPSEISLYDIVVALEGIDIMECLKSGTGCPLMQSCGVRIVWKQFEERFENLLRDFNLQDILREKENLAKTQGVYTYQI
jgi:Rrf2 family protein